MPTPVAGPAIFVGHFFILLFLIWSISGHLYGSKSYRTAATILLAWANLLYTGLLLGALHLLDQAPL